MAKRTERREIVIFMCLIAFASLIFAFTSTSFIPSDQEWESLMLGKQLSEGDYRYLGHYRYGMLYPVLIRDFIWIFGSNPEVVTIISFLSLLLAVSSIYIISKVLFGKRLAGIVGVLLFTLSTHVITFFSIYKGHPGLSLGFISLSLALFSLAYKRGKTYLYLLALLSIVLASQIKIENGVILFTFLLGFIIFNGLDPRKYLRSKESLRFRNLLVSAIILLVFLSLLSPYILKGMERQKSYEDKDFVTCGLPKYEIEQSPLYINKTVPVHLKFINGIIKELTNNRFGLENINDETLSWFTSLYNHPFFILVILGSVLSILGLRTKWREILFLVLAFIIPTCVYLLDCNFYIPRYAIATMAPLFVLSGYGFYKLGELLSKLFKQERAFYVIFVLVTASALFLSLSSGIYVKTYPNHYSYVPEMTNLIERESGNPVILTSHRNDQFKFMFFSNFTHIYTIEDLLYEKNPEFGVSYMEVYYENKTLAKEILTFPFSKNRSNFFIHGGSCVLNDYHKEGCGKIFEAYETKEIMRSYLATLYEIVV